jgi:tetraacyldisaccharide 4'-kinase
MLPLGYLREPPSALARANAIALTRCELVDEATLESVESGLKMQFSSQMFARIRTRWTGVTYSDQPDDIRPIDAVDNHSVMIVCGIGNPNAFEASARQAGLTVVDRQFLPDHATYSCPMMQQIIQRASRLNADILTTHKDWVKLNSLVKKTSPRARFIIPHLEIEPGPGFDVLWQAMIAVIDKGGQ